MSTTFRGRKTDEEEEEEKKEEEEEEEEIFNPFKEEEEEQTASDNEEVFNPFKEDLEEQTASDNNENEEEEEVFNPFKEEEVKEENEEANYQPEIDKLLTLYQKGFIDRDMVDLASKLLGIELDLVDYKQIGDNLVRMPIIIIAKPSYFGTRKQEIPEADIADPYSKKYPIISLLSLEKTINTLANAKMPWKRFSIVVDSSYSLPSSSTLLLEGLLDILKKAGYNVKLYTTIGEEHPMDNGLVSELIEPSLVKVLCHAKKVQGLDNTCDDSRWWEYNLWGTAKKNVLDQDKVKQTALKYNVSPVLVRYIANSIGNQKLLRRYAESFNVPVWLVMNIAKELSSSS